MTATNNSEIAPTHPQAKLSGGEGGGGATELGGMAGGGAAEVRGRQVEVGPGDVLQPLGGEEGGSAREGRGRVVLVVVLQQLRVRGQRSEGDLEVNSGVTGGTTHPAQHQRGAVDHAALWLHPQATSGVALLKLGPVDLQETPGPIRGFASTISLAGWLVDDLTGDGNTVRQ